MPIWFLPAAAILTGLVFAFVVLDRRGRPVGLALSALCLVIGVSWGAGIKKAHCPSDDQGFLSPEGERSRECKQETDACCVELLPVASSTCVMSEESGVAFIWEGDEHYYLSSHYGDTGVAACIDWRFWRSW